jgi:beta-phosphoglucomutase
VFRATLFDYNGVLVNDEAVHLEAFRDVLRPLGITLSDQDYWQRYLGFDDVGAFRALFEHAGRPATSDVIAALVEAKRPRYLGRARSALEPFEGAAEAVRRRARSGPVGIVSGALRDEIELGLELLAIADQIAFIVSAEDTLACKPDPEGYRLAIAKLGERARDCVVIEDSLAGVEAAKAAGASCIGVAHSYDAGELLLAGADRVVPGIAELHDPLLEELHRSLDSSHG